MGGGETVVLNWGQFLSPREHLAIIEDIYGCHNFGVGEWGLGVTDFCWAEARDAA